MHHYYQVLIVLMPCALLVLGQQQDIAAAVKACIQSSALNSCSQYGEAGGLQSLNTEEAGVFIPRLELHLLQPPVDVKATFVNNTLTGLSLFKLNSVGVNKTNATLSMSITIPQLRAVGNYELSGTAFVPLGFSASSYSAQFQDVQISGEAKLMKAEKGGQLAIEGTPSLNVGLSNMTVAFDNLLEGKKPHISQLVHSFVNQEPKLFVADFQPEIRKRVSGLLDEFYARVISGVDPALFGL
jgi:hypothetical protein